MRKYLAFLIFNLLFSCSIHAKTIYIVPYPNSNPQLTFFHPFSSYDESAKKWVVLREELEKMGYNVQFTLDAENLEDFTALFSITNINAKLLKNLKSYSKERCWLFNLEPPVYLPGIYKESVDICFGKNFVMFDDLVDNKHYIKLHYPQPRLKMDAGIPDFLDKKFCILIAGNKHSNHPQELYSERKKAISFFSDLPTEEFDLFGHGWEGYKKWRGPIKRKWDVLKYYKFCICYENMKDQLGYISEKIFDCFVAGCVPIYWGASNISDYIPEKCYIDRRVFSSDSELYDFLADMDRTTYEEYLEAIREYLDSSRSQVFSIDHFIQMIKKHLSELG